MHEHYEKLRVELGEHWLLLWEPTQFGPRSADDSGFAKGPGPHGPGLVVGSQDPAEVARAVREPLP